MIDLGWRWLTRMGWTFIGIEDTFGGNLPNSFQFGTPCKCFRKIWTR